MQAVPIEGAVRTGGKGFFCSVFFYSKVLLCATLATTAPPHRSEILPLDLLLRRFQAPSSFTIPSPLEQQVLSALNNFCIPQSSLLLLAVVNVSFTQFTMYSVHSYFLKSNSWCVCGQKNVQLSDLKINTQKRVGLSTMLRILRLVSASDFLALNLMLTLFKQKIYLKTMKNVPLYFPKAFPAQQALNKTNFIRRKEQPS